ncbi:MAG: glycosyltransferase family 39 protein [Phycisphaeraceae bacterium]
MVRSQKQATPATTPRFDRPATPSATPVARPASPRTGTPRTGEDVELARVTPLPPRVATWLFIAALLGATLLGAGLRLYQLDRPSFWADELYSLRSITDEQPPPLWRILSHSATWAGLQFTGADLAAADRDAPELWQSLGINHFAARIGPALIGVLTIPLLAFAGRRVLGDRGAILLALLVAVLPWHIEWSQNARFYVPLFLFYGLSVLLYFDATTRYSRARLVMAMLCFVLAFMHHPPGIFLAGVFAADWLASWGMRQRPRLGAFGYISVAVAVGLCLAVLIIDMNTMAAGYNRLEGQPRGHSVAMLLAGTAYLVHPVVIACAGFAGWLLLARRERLGSYLLLAALVPLAVLIWFSATDRMFVHVRYGFMASIGYVALTAIALDRLYALAAPRFGRVFAAAPAVAVLIPLLMVDGFYHSGGYGFRSRWDEGFQYVQQHAGPEATVATNFTLAGRYYTQRADLVGFPASAEALEAMAEAAEGPVWLVTAVESAQGAEEQQWIDDVANLQAYFDTRIEQPFSSIRVYRYEGPR